MLQVAGAVLARLKSKHGRPCQHVSHVESSKESSDLTQQHLSFNDELAATSWTKSSKKGKEPPEASKAFVRASIGMHALDKRSKND